METRQMGRYASGARDVLSEQHRGSPAHAFHLRRPALLGEAIALRHALADWARARHLPADLAADLQLAVFEAMTNVAEHAYAADSAGLLDLHAQHGVRAVRVTVTDRGRWRPQPDPSHGRGLPLIHLLADHSAVTTTPKGTVVAMAWQLPYQPRSG